MEKKFVLILCAATIGLIGTIAVVFDFLYKVEAKSISAEFIEFAETNKLKDYYDFAKNSTIGSAYIKFSDELEKLLKYFGASKLFDGYEKLKTDQDVLAQFKIAYVNRVPHYRINESLIKDLKKYANFISVSDNINEENEEDLIKFKCDLENFFKKNGINLKSADVPTIFGSKLLSSHFKSLTVSDEESLFDCNLIHRDLMLITELKLINVKSCFIQPFNFFFSRLKKLEICDAEDIYLGSWADEGLESLKVSGKNIYLGKLDKFTKLKELVVELKGGTLFPEIKDATSFLSNQHDLKVKLTGTLKPLTFKVPAKKKQN